MIKMDNYERNYELRSEAYFRALREGKNRAILSDLIISFQKIIDNEYLISNLFLAD